MAEREVVKYPDPVLRKHAKSVTKVDANTKKLVEDMVATMHATNGVGLAANQVGVLQRIFVYDDGNGLGVMVNPEIVSMTGQQTGPEGCLSLPGLQGDVTRANEVVIKGTNLKGKPVKIQAEGFLARIFQHEFDHLNGKLFIDRADPETLHYPDDDEEDLE
ncbi:MAG TPA: peptide deformylase [Armatimonadota bacterium]|jgi:peptide deformylase